MLIKLFENLSIKFRNENALSDMTWAMCETSEVFRNLFLNFFFPNYNFNNIIEFRREYSLGNSRPDFYIKNNNDIFLIEVKIKDTNHHFDQYVLEFEIPNSNLGYITNYNLYQNEYSVKTWKSFFNYLKFEKDKIEKEESSLFKAYLVYISNICSIREITNKMDLNSLQTVLDFNDTVKDVTNFETENFRIESYKQEIKIHRTGYYFRVIDLNGKKKDIWIWLGAYFEKQEHQICIAVENGEGWGKPFYEIIDPNKIANEDNTYFFYPSFNTNYFNELETYELQKLFLKEFVIEVVQKYLK
ncbi:MAG TPA: hypothetical protein DCQ31_02410 [Bacteroidales bacterium]|nr:hypothetical protein [Bacteroidales bacterium]